MGGENSTHVCILVLASMVIFLWKSSLVIHQHWQYKLAIQPGIKFPVSPVQICIFRMMQLTEEEDGKSLIHAQCSHVMYEDYLS